jgi:hypothetical protein
MGQGMRVVLVTPQRKPVGKYEKNRRKAHKKDGTVTKVLEQQGHKFR